MKTKPPATRPGRQAGLTLMQVMTALAIVGVIAAWLLTRYGA